MVLRRFGYDVWWYKGIVAGNIIWITGLSIGLRALAGIRPDYPSFGLEAALEHQIFGLVAVYLIRRWSGP